MSALDTLRLRLQVASQQVFQRLVLDQTALEKEVKQLTAWLKTGSSAKPPRDLIVEALRKFYREQKTDNLRDTRLVTYGYIDEFGNSKCRLIEDGQRFPKLLECVDQYRKEPRQFRRCYRGLLSGYFIYNPEVANIPASGKRNWETLRTYLHDRTTDLTDSGMLPDWVPAIGGHRNLLTDNPCTRYGLSLLKGEGGEFSEAQRALEIPEGSWVISRLVLAAIDAATRVDDAAFTKYVPKVLDLIDAHEVLLNPGLALVLHRYQRGTNLGLSPELRDFSVGRWGNPWLARNSAQWSLVPAATRSMVADWLKLELIHKFFNLLAEDGNSDNRRLQFWQRYHKHINDMYFALGRRAVTDRSEDFKRLKKDMQGRLLGLRAGGPPENNAFIMCIGDYVVVEFGVRANACYIFKRDTLPFELAGNVSGDGTELKHDSHTERLPHIDRKRQSWEQTFESTLSRLLGVRPASTDELPVGVGIPSRRNAAASPRTTIRPETRASADKSGSAPQAGNQANAPSRLSAVLAVATPFSLKALEQFCTERGVKSRDLTSSGGNLWVYVDAERTAVNAQLVAWGFRYKPGKGWWR